MSEFFGQERLLGPSIPLAVDRRHPAEHLGFAEDLVVAMQIPRIAAPLVADLQELAGFLLTLDHLPGLRQIVGHLLLAVDVESGLHAGDGVLGVPEVGRRDDDRVDVALLLVEHLFVVDIGVVLVPVAIQQARYALLVVSLPNVADSLELDVRDLEAGFHQDLPLGAGAEQGHVDVLLAAAGCGKHPRRKGQAGADRCGGTQKTASIDTRLCF